MNRLIPRVSRVCLTLTRQYRGSSTRSRSVPDPGVSRRLEIIKQDSPEVVRSKIDDNVLEDLENDFFNAKDIRDEHAREMNRIKSKIAFSSIERKYFKRQPSPNMLLWSEKEQIRMLYHSEPENWTPERLASSFPATVDVIKKIVNSSWKPDSPERIQRHDKKVEENWKKFSEGKLDVDEKIRSHLNKFTSRRNLVFEEKQKIPAVDSFKKEIPQTVSKEFINIAVRTAVKQSASNSPTTLSRPVTRGDTYLIEEDPRNRRSIRDHMTLDALRRASNERSADAGDLSAAFEQGKEETPSDGEQLTKGLINPEAPVLMYNDEREVEEEGDARRRYYVPSDGLPRKIKIPSDKRVKGKLYRVKNSYYTDDGEFLFRI